MVTRTRHNVTLCIHWLSCYLSDFYHHHHHNHNHHQLNCKRMCRQLSCSTISKGGRSVKLKTHSASFRFTVPSYMQHFYLQPHSSMKSHLFSYVSDILWSESKGLLVHHWWNSISFIKEFRNTFLPFLNLHSHVSWSSRGTSLSHKYLTPRGSPSEATLLGQSRTLLERIVYCSAVHGPPLIPDTHKFNPPTQTQFLEYPPKYPPVYPPGILGNSVGIPTRYG